MTTLALPRPSDSWIEREHGLVIPSDRWFAVPKHLRREIRFGRVDAAWQELQRLLGWAKTITENPLIGGTALERSATDATSYTTGSFTPTSGSVQIATIGCNQAFGSPRTPTTPTNWTLITSRTNSSFTLLAYWAQLSGSQTILWDFGANTMSGAIWTVQEFAGCHATTPINSNFISATGASTTPTGTLPNSFVDANSGVFATDFAGNDTVIHTAGTGYTQIYDSGLTDSFNNVRLATEWRNSNNSSPSFTLNSSQGWTFLACELVAAQSALPPGLGPRIGMIMDDIATAAGALLGYSKRLAPRRLEPSLR